MCYIGSSSPYKKNQDGVDKKALFHFKLVTTETSQTWTEVAEFQNKHVQISILLRASGPFHGQCRLVPEPYLSW